MNGLRKDDPLVDSFRKLVDPSSLARKLYDDAEMGNDAATVAGIDIDSPLVPYKVLTFTIHSAVLVNSASGMVIPFV